MSLRLVPAAAHPTSFTHIRAAHTTAPSAPGLHDPLRAGLGPDPLAAASTSTSTTTTTTHSSAPVSAHPLEARLGQWQATQEGLRMAALRRAFGIAEPVRRGMELAIARGGEWRPLALGGGAGGASVSEDILRGREATVDWEDVFTGEELRAAVGVHEEMERKLRI